MSIANFIPQYWIAKCQQVLQKDLVFLDCVNTEYEGVISQAGDSVKINGIGPLTIGSYTRNSTSVVPETLEDTSQTMVIDQSDFFSFQVDDLDKAQATGNFVDAGMQMGSYGLKDTADRYVAGMYNQASNIIATVAINSLNVFAILLSMAQALDEKNVPSEGRWIVLPPWLVYKLVLAKLMTENTSNDAFTNGKCGVCAGFTVYKSNNVYNTGGTYYPIAGHKMAITFANQIAKVEAFKPEAKFADAVKALHVYGGKVVYPDALVTLTCTVLAEA